MTDANDSELQIHNLQILHSLVEVICLINTNIMVKVSLETIRTVIVKVLNQFETTIAFEFGIQIPLPVFSTATAKIVDSITKSTLPSLIKHERKIANDEVSIYLSKRTVLENPDATDWNISYKKQYSY